MKSKVNQSDFIIVIASVVGRRRDPRMTAIFLSADSIKWLQGKNRFSSYKVPEAERFTNCFCRQYGSRLPRYVPELKLVMLPAGSLDSEPSVKPEADIFWDSRAGWGCVAGDVPVYAEYVTEK